MHVCCILIPYQYHLSFHIAININGTWLIIAGILNFVEYHIIEMCIRLQKFIIENLFHILGMIWETLE